MGKGRWESRKRKGGEEREGNNAGCAACGSSFLNLFFECRKE